MTDPRGILTESRDRSLARFHKLAKARAGRPAIVYPVAAVREARLAGLPLSVACALLEKESGGGRNVFGHDPVRPPQQFGGNVTQERYLRYKRLRRSHGMQGVGPTQLTYHTYQDRADRLGGCWRPSCNMAVGFDILAKQIRAADGNVAEAGARYNGGPSPSEQARRYGRDLKSKAAAWRRLFDADRAAGNPT